MKRAVNFISDFEVAVAREAKARGLQGVVCGHIHHAEIRDIDGVLYCNDGDWVESLTALAEHADGRLEILEWSTQAPVPIVTPQPVIVPVAAPLPEPLPEPVMARRAH